MSIEETERTLQEYLGALTSKGDLARFFAPDVVWTTMETGEVVRGREEVAGLISALHGTLFDAVLEVRTIAAMDGLAVLEADLVATHVGEFAGIPPTGAEVRLSYCVVYDIAAPMITALRAYVPMAVLVQHLHEAAAGTPS